MGVVFDIFRTSLNDGPGVRTTVFLKGCPLRCRWCHNPESYFLKPQLFFMLERCVGCKECQRVCQNGCHTFINEKHHIDFSKCTACGKCCQACLTESLSIKGSEMTKEQVMGIVLKDKSFYNASNGGITISGGEPLLQWEFTRDLLKLAKENGIHTCVETSGYCDSDKFTEVVKYCDLLLFDCKGVDNKKHKLNTGVDNSIIKKNLSLCDKDVYLRCPLIPGVNDSEEDLRLILDYAKSHDCIKQVEIMPYHDMGRQKQDRISNRNELIDIPSAGTEDIDRWKKILLSGSGLDTVKLIIN